MEYVYATLLVNQTGQEINEKNLTGVLDAAGCPVQESRIKALVAALEGVDLADFESVDPDTGMSGIEEPPTRADHDGPEAGQPKAETDEVARETEAVGEMDRTSE